MEQRNSFVFFRSFYEAVLHLRPREQTQVILAICDYALNRNEQELSGIAEAIFLLIKPHLDANQRKYEQGKRGGRPSAHPKPEEPKMETNEGCGMGDASCGMDDGGCGMNDASCGMDDGGCGMNDASCGMVDGGCGRGDGEGEMNPAAAAVLDAYRQLVCPRISRSAREELASFADDLGCEVCLRAIDAALDAGKGNWPYIRGILRAKREQGVRSLADWDAAEARRGRPAEPSSSGNVFMDILRDLEAKEGKEAHGGAGAGDS